MDTLTPRSYSTREVADAADVSYRQLDYWCRLGLISPEFADARGSGSRRRFSLHDMAIVRVLGVVTATAQPCPLNRLDQLVGFLTDLPLQQWAATTVVIDKRGDVWRLGPDAPKVGTLVDLSLVFDEVDA